MNAQNILKPNADAISAFLYVLFAPSVVLHYANAWIEIVCAKPGAPLNTGYFFSAHDLKAIVAFVVKKNSAGYNCYVGAAVRHGEKPESGRASKQHFCLGTHFWVDCDNAGDYERLVSLCKKNGLQPNMEIATGTQPHHRAQVFFKCAGPITEGRQLESGNTALRDFFESDHVQNYDRVMRIAGTISYPKAEKVARGYATELTSLRIERDAPGYSVEKLCSLRPAKTTTANRASISTSVARTDYYDLFQQFADEQHRAAGRLTDGDMDALLEKHPNGEGANWHNDMLAVTWELLCRGYEPYVIQKTIGLACKKGSDDPDIGRLVYKKWEEFQAQKREAEHSDAEEREPSARHKRPLIIATPYAWTASENIPPREFLYGCRLIRKYATATIAPGGVGKTALEVAEVLSMVSGKALLGVQTPQLRVWLWSLEDPREEMVRRIQATAKHYNLTAENIADRLFLDSGREQPLVIAEMQRNGVVIYRPVVEALIAQLKERAIDILIIDPFVSCHRVTENDNNAIDAVTKEWARVADAANCAVELVHHVRKGEQEITVESARGGGSFGDACRMVRVINRMTEQQAKDTGISNRRIYFRTYLDKNNLAPPADKSEWYKLVSVDLGNGPLGGAGGDSIGVVTKWEWPDATKDLTGRDFERVAGAIRAGNWRADIQAKQWVGRAVAKALALDLDDRAKKAAVKQLIKYWIGTGALVVVKRETEKREMKEFVEVSEKVE
ncbi:hypothetical protein BRDID11004_16240 [Bradyrhizobium diazoefficiens]|uniref:Uncharacterized protein n=1 Tax=Bradyrhizobium diazoefficiens TaxID=1355477 RepID=A0A810A7T0_9BRAD|nr:AAA family ATPase [Bradyrhizobium diazoefficiens]BBZ97464.1 hypothetical protein F07S3_72970 [Bradyrhizobium diazoefficiens]BCA15148.1 hypothetical protein BDHF08_69950 [Bradyrhizobium diazoefficiens]BCE59560.1 hypothetical protein XF5B_70720 [Bradyrhizobium diazoefficiens]BCE68243.1 hypothetical protein XF6B_70420 [Bradyrhizobium diazoefficiens]